MNIFQTLFPAIFSAVTGNVPGAILDVAKVFGADPATLPDTTAISDKLKDATIDQIVSLRQLELKQIELQNADINSARNLQATTRERFLPILACSTVTGTFIIVAYLLHFGVPEANKAIVYTLVGNILAWPTLILNFYFGSSSSSEIKNKIISGMQDLLSPKK